MLINFVTCEASFATSSLRIENWFDSSQRAWRKFVVIFLISRCCTSKHDIITIFTAWCTHFWIMLHQSNKFHRKSLCNYLDQIRTRENANLPVNQNCGRFHAPTLHVKRPAEHAFHS